MKTLMLYSLVCLIIPFSQSQSQPKDSLDVALEKASGNDRIKILHQLALKFSTRDSTKAFAHAKEALVLSSDGDDSKQLAKAHMILGTVFQENFQYSQAETHFLTADSIYQITNWSKGLGSVAKALGNSELTQGYFEPGIALFKHALRHFSDIQDTTSMLGAYYNIGYGNYRLRNYDSAIYYYYKILPFCESGASQTCIDMYNQLGTVYSEIKEPEKALSYLMLSLEGSLANEDSVSAANVYMNIAGNYFYQGKMDSCAFFVNQSIDIYKQMGHLQGQLYGLNNLSIIYKETGEIDKSFAPTANAIQVAKKINDRGTMAGSYLNMSDLWYFKNKYRMAELYADSAFTIMRDLKSKYHLQQYYMVMAKLKKAQNDLASAYDMRELYHVYKDSMVNEQKNKQIAELETRYETEKKEQQITILSNEKELQAAIIEQSELQLQRNQALILALFALLGGLLLLGAFFYKRQQFAQRIKIETERSAMKADQIKAVIQSQEQERKRFAMDLHDDFGQLISALRINVNQSSQESHPQKSNKANALLDDMYASLKNIAFNLMPQTLLQKGLTAALEELCLQLNELGNMKFDLRVFEVNEEDFPSSHKVAIYRIVQELLNNIIKYANADKVDINLTGFEGQLSILVEDDGEGFDVQQLKEGLGHGWRNISSRLDLMNGEIEYDSLKGKRGTSVTVSIPYAGVQKMVA